ncbi:PR5-like receptor kinase [Hibiscus syriacus]|uniref:PR5-like receptor kinase n=1 Tax=Hibiscus syriacus TaxID=106335 RepID=A0A6A3ATD3_HIBSY|nr:rust resistance kinase Lr10-like [Hibiscus syriacus]KAE8706162.1 PR5-like receptor kinase [Hibiscus syriacus]
MSKLPLLGHLVAAYALFLLVFPGACLARHRNQECESVFCGSLNISHPFRLKDQPRRCGDHRYELECDKNNRATVVLEEGEFSVLEIFYENGSMRVVDANLNMDDCNSLPLSSMHPQYLYFSGFFNPSCEDHSYYGNQDGLYFAYVLNCTEPIKSSWYIEASRCATELATSYYYFFLDPTAASDLSQSCTVEAIVPFVSDPMERPVTTRGIYRDISKGFVLSWCNFSSSGGLSFQDVLYHVRYGLQVYFRYIYYYYVEGEIDYYKACSLCIGVPAGAIILRTSSGILCLVVLVIYKWRRRHLSADDKIEEFLENYNLSPIRYSFKQIRKMTRGFKEKLGEGGYGSVFKGKLRSGHHVAVKLLGKSKGNGQDFINEVASMGRIHHANVAKLVGFCVEGSKQALVYDFMSNGSLDKIIFTEENKNALGWKKMLEIVLGVARGIDYLHQGCDMQILHFDIKPHNILLDHNFNPKVSDFGLAKLYSVDESIVSLTAARGTIGYIAPELVYKNLGGISYKADVYSFGMLLMEMVGKRKNVNAFADHTSQIYFPSWIYDRLDQGEDMELGDASDDEKVMVRKMLITAFWCIQLHPADRPSMSKVLRMLENEDELLEMPPKPFHRPPVDTSSKFHCGESPNIDESTTSMDSITVSSRSNVV